MSARHICPHVTLACPEVSINEFPTTMPLETIINPLTASFCLSRVVQIVFTQAQNRDQTRKARVSLGEAA